MRRDEGKETAGGAALSYNLMESLLHTRTRTHTHNTRAIHLYTSAGQRVSNGFSQRVDVLPKLPNRVSLYEFVQMAQIFLCSIYDLQTNSMEGFFQTKMDSRIFFFFFLNRLLSKSNFEKWRIGSSLKNARISINWFLCFFV